MEIEGCRIKLLDRKIGVIRTPWRRWAFVDRCCWQASWRWEVDVITSAPPLRQPQPCPHRADASFAQDYLIRLLGAMPYLDYAASTNTHTGCTVRVGPSQLPFRIYKYTYNETPRVNPRILWMGGPNKTLLPSHLPRLNSLLSTQQ